MAVESPESFRPLLDAAIRVWSRVVASMSSKTSRGAGPVAPYFMSTSTRPVADDSTIRPGQYVLKMQKYQVWDHSPEPTENERHRQAEAANADSLGPISQDW